MEFYYKKDKKKCVTLNYKLNFVKQLMCVREYSEKPLIKMEWILKHPKLLSAYMNFIS